MNKSETEMNLYLLMSSHSSKLVPIRTVCAFYQLNANTLRTWERRYNIIRPDRSSGGHRGYSEADIIISELMLKLLKEGASPSEAAQKVKQQQSGNGVAKQPALDLQPLFTTAITSLDMVVLGELIQESNVKQGYTATMEKLLFPELAALGAQWENKQEAIAHEHFLSLAVKSFILERHRQLLPQSNGPAVLVACVPGENHDLPALHLGNLLLETKQVHPIILTAGLPVKDILAAAKSTQSEVLILSSSLAPRPDVLRQWLSELIEDGWESRTILAGGGFQRSRVFSESKFRSAPGNYQQTVRLIVEMAKSFRTI